MIRVGIPVVVDRVDTMLLDIMYMFRPNIDIEYYEKARSMTAVFLTGAC